MGIQCYRLGSLGLFLEKYRRENSVGELICEMKKLILEDRHPDSFLILDCEVGCLCYGTLRWLLVQLKCSIGELIRNISRY